MNIFLIFKNACGKSPCHNNATCQTGFTNKGYRCLCATGFSGHHCKRGKKSIFKSVLVTFSCSSPLKKRTRNCNESPVRGRGGGGGGGVLHFINFIRGLRVSEYFVLPLRGWYSSSFGLI